MAKARKRKKIRTALIRCDTHGYYFGMLMARCDPLFIEKANKIVHYYATDWYDPANIILPTTYDFDIVRCWDPDFERAEEFSQAFLGKPQPCRTLAEATEGVDFAFVGDCDGGGGDHLKLSRPFIRKGIPTFVDKPFASNLKDARAIVSLARRHSTPIYNSSILTEVVAADNFKRRFPEITPEGANWTELAQAAVGMDCSVKGVDQILGVVKGVGGAMSQENLGDRDALGGIEDRLAYIIHGIALALNVFGPDVEWVEAMGSLPLEYLHLHLTNGRDVMVMNPGVDVFPERCSFYVEAYSKMGAIHSGPIGDPEFLRGADRIVKKIRNMVRTGKPPRDYDDIVMQIAVVDAGQIAQRTGKRVAVADVIRGKLRVK
jgi:hypothetical protein